MKAYIRNVSSISPQGTFENIQSVSHFAAPAILHALEPDYKALIIDAGLRRRMSRFVRMGVAAGLQCLQGFEDAPLDGIVTATGLGCMEDTRKFLQAISDNNEQLLTPTAFIQSTFNTVGAQLGLIRKCHSYNLTYVHRGFSFESALLDAMLLLGEGASNVLVGAVDEQTPDTYAIFKRLDTWKNQEQVDDLYAPQSKGTVAGEGAQFALLAATPSAADYGVVQGLCTFHTQSGADVNRQTQAFLAQHGMLLSDVGMLLLGEDGDCRHQHLYSNVRQAFSGTQIERFKHLCGEYATASSFGFWMASNLLKAGKAKNILMVNHYGNSACSLVLLTAC